MISTSFKLFSDDKCGEIISKFNASTQICVQNTNIDSISPLIATSENSDFLVGFGNEEAVPNATIFNLINQKSYNLPIYDRCDSEKEFPSHFALCNSFEISENLKDSCHSEIILVGNIEVGNNKSFIPIEFGIVVSDDQILVSSKVNESLENYQIYGNGEKLKVALMLDNIVIEEDSFISNVTTKNGKTFHILKV
uniref:FIST domain-containing protein n=1 Tax=Panagrolaimus davidi TaxID=227884 RepID=A0A914PAD5_9BILA